MPRPRVTNSPVADHYADKTRERIIEFNSGKVGGPGGLISFRRQDDDTLDVHIYRTDPGVRAYVGPEAQTGTGITFTRQQIETWVGHKLTDTDITRLAACIPKSSIPQAVETIVHVGMEVENPDDGVPLGRCGCTKSGVHVMADDHICEACGESFEVG